MTCTILLLAIALGRLALGECAERPPVHHCSARRSRSRRARETSQVTNMYWTLDWTVLALPVPSNQPMRRRRGTQVVLLAA